MKFLTHSNIIVLSILMLYANSVNAQDTEDAKIYLNPTIIGVGMGTINFYGDYGRNNSKSKTYNTFDYNTHFQIEKIVRNNLGMIGAFFSSKASLEERASEANNFKTLNFQSKLNGISFGAHYHFNTKKKEKETFITPSVSLGAGFMMFKSFADAKDASGKPYFYWSDGTIRSEGEYGPYAGTAKVLQRDYNYESDQSSESSIFFPMQLGIDFKLSKKVNMQLSSTLNYTLTDIIDNVENKSQDLFIYSAFSLHYIIGVKEIEEEPGFEGIDFTAMDVRDIDSDSVKDIFDNCAATPSIAKTDGKGCPQQLTDADGIPDYKDKQPQTKTGAMVNLDGVEITSFSIMAQETFMETGNIILKESDSVFFDFMIPNVSQGDTLIIENLTKQKSHTISGYSLNTKHEVTDVANGDKILIKNKSKNENYVVIAIYHKTLARKGGKLFINTPSEQHANNAESNIIFKVQLAASTRLIPLNSDVFKGLTGINVEKEEGERTYRYTLGYFKDADSAQGLAKKLRNQGMNDAFVVVYKNSKRLAGEEAKKLIGK